MSLTNPNKVITEQRLSDFYQGILPYLGGMPEMIANKFSKGDLYSTEEKIIGQWTNGKPVYQKVVIVENPDNSWGENSYGVENIELLISADARFNINNSWWGSEYYISNSEYIRSLFLNPFFRVQSTYNITKVVVIIQYTKTTDSAISIGSETDYSTDEKIVGTWIDGKPLYQITVEYDASSMIFDGQTTNQLPIIRDVSIDTVVEFRGIFGREDGGARDFFNTPSTRVDNIIYQTQINIGLNPNTVYFLSKNSTTKKLWITLQYTKTT